MERQSHAKPSLKRSVGAGRHVDKDQISGSPLETPSDRERSVASRAPERHLLVFWRWPADRLEETLDKIRERLEIDQILLLHWTKERIVENFQRFYAMVSGQAYQKYTQAGAAPFLFVLVTDPKPLYRYRIAAGSGFKKVNINCFDLKQMLRKQGNTSLHATNDQREFRRDLMFLMGKPADDYHPTKWDGDIKSISEVHRDIVAADGWESLAQVFSVMNEAVTYVVLRNFDKLPDEHVHGAHGDVDLLLEDVDARNRAASILNKDQRGTTIVGGRKVSFDFRSIEDFYYDPEWCRRILRDRIMVRGFYAPNPEDHFFSLLYHGHVQKPKIADDYIPTLMGLAREIGLDWITPEWLTKPEKAASLLGDWLKGSGFCLTRPNGCPQYNWAFVARLNNIPSLQQSTSISKKIANVMSRNYLLRPLIPHALAARNRLRRMGLAQKVGKVANLLKRVSKNAPFGKL